MDVKQFHPGAIVARQIHPGIEFDVRHGRWKSSFPFKSIDGDDEGGDAFEIPREILLYVAGKPPSAKTRP